MNKKGADGQTQKASRAARHFPVSSDAICHGDHQRGRGGAAVLGQVVDIQGERPGDGRALLVCNIPEGAPHFHY